MAERWELICHHTYTGIAGVVVDTAPLAPSPGQLSNLDASDFLIDGAAPGSGAVKFIKRGSIHVPTEATPWKSIVGVKGEVTFRRLPGNIGFLIDGNSFQFYIRSDALVAHFSCLPLGYAEIVSTFDPAAAPAFRVPTEQWITVGFAHDGFGTMELYANGRVVARRGGVYGPVNPPGPAGLVIGSAQSQDYFMNGEIDEVKIWRLNPRRFDDDFYRRPMDDKTADCWKHFCQEIDAAFKRHPDCAKQIAGGLNEVIERLTRQALTKGPETAAHLLNSAHEYRRLWRTGDVAGTAMVKVITDLIAWLRLVRLSPEADPAFAALVGSDCMNTILAEVKPPDCDPKVQRLLRSVVKNLSRAGGTPVAQARALRRGDGRGTP
jgi:hypothetical protein